MNPIIRVSYCAFTVICGLGNYASICHVYKFAFVALFGLADMYC